MRMDASPTHTQTRPDHHTRTHSRAHAKHLQLRQPLDEVSTYNTYMPPINLATGNK